MSPKVRKRSYARAHLKTLNTPKWPMATFTEPEVAYMVCRAAHSSQIQPERIPCGVTSPSTSQKIDLDQQNLTTIMGNDDPEGFQLAERHPEHPTTTVRTRPEEAAATGNDGTVKSGVPEVLVFGCDSSRTSQDLILSKKRTEEIQKVCGRSPPGVPCRNRRVPKNLRFPWTRTYAV